MNVRVAAEDRNHFPKSRRVQARGVTYFLGHQIGRGAFSTVYKAQDDWGNLLAVKILSKSLQPLWEREAHALRLFRHPCVVHLFDAFEFGAELYLVTGESGLSLSRVRLPQERRVAACVRTAKGVLQALHFIHSRQFVHGDVYPNNILVKDPGAGGPAGVRLCDFAFCRPASDRKDAERQVTPWQIAPETLDASNYGDPGTPADVYRAALALLELLRGERVAYTADEALAGLPRQDALASALPLAHALADALQPHPGERPTALGLWLQIQRAFRLLQEPGNVPVPQPELPAR